MGIIAGKRPSAAGVIAVGALVVTLGGSTAVASGSLQHGDKLIKKHTLSGNRLRSHTVGASQLKQPVWHPLTLANGWTAYDVANYGTPSYTIDDQGFVHLRGVVKGDASTADTLTQLPAGFIPSEPNVFVPVASKTGSGPQAVVLDIQHTGFVTADAGPGGGSFAFVSLAGVTFPAG